MNRNRKINHERDLTKAIFLLTLAEAIACGILLYGSVLNSKKLKHQ